MIKTIKKYLTFLKKIIPRHECHWSHLGLTGYYNATVFLPTGRTEFCIKCRKYREIK